MKVKINPNSKNNEVKTTPCSSNYYKGGGENYYK